MLRHGYPKRKEIYIECKENGKGATVATKDQTERVRSLLRSKFSPDYRIRHAMPIDDEASGKIFIGKIRGNKPNGKKLGRSRNIHVGVSIGVSVFYSEFCLHTSDQTLRDAIGGDWQLEDLYGNRKAEADALASALSKALKSISVVPTMPLADFITRPDVSGHSGLRAIIQLMEYDPIDKKR